MSTDELSELNLNDDFQQVLNTEDAGRWELEKPAPLEVWCSMSSSRLPAEMFQVRLLWQSYPGHAPSLKFRDSASGRLDLPQAWPVLPGFRPTSLDACVNWCAEGLKLHPEWQKDPRYAWDSNGNVLLRVLRTLQEELDEHCQGRFK
jgi:hypothetical protein